MIERKSKDAFKRLVRSKAKEYALRTLLKKKSQHSKMDNVSYRELKTQNYLLDEKLTTEEKKTAFKYRTRMENYGENYRGGKSQVFCPLCSLHLDNQEQSFQCQVIKDNLNLTRDVRNLYKENIDVNTVKAFCKISDYRKQII